MTSERKIIKWVVSSFQPKSYRYGIRGYAQTEVKRLGLKFNKTKGLWMAPVYEINKEE